MGICWRYIGDTSHTRQIRNVFSEYTFKDTYIHTLILTYIQYIHVKYIYKYIFFHWLLVLLQKSIYIITMWILLIQSLKYSKKKRMHFLLVVLISQYCTLRFHLQAALESSAPTIKQQQHM